MATDETTSRAVEVSSPERPPTAAQQRATSHEGTTDTEVLAQDIERTREELAETIDAIVDKVSPKKVVERTKQQASVAAKQGLHDASVVAKETASTAAAVLKEKTGTATEAVKGAAATVKEKVSGGSDSTPDSSPLHGATSVAIGSATPVAATPAGTTSTTGTAGTTGDDIPAGLPTGPSPLPSSTVSIDAGAVPPAEPGAGSLADRAEPAGTGATVTGTTGTGTAGTARTPLTRPAGAPSPSPVPVAAGAGVAALVALLLLLLRRRRR